MRPAVRRVLVIAPVLLAGALLVLAFGRGRIEEGRCTLTPERSIGTAH